MEVGQPPATTSQYLVGSIHFKWVSDVNVDISMLV